jgi:lipopolysaccharide transport system ATP-binding protein
VSTAISVDGVSKRYRLAHDRAGSLKEALLRRQRSREVDEFWALRDVSLGIAKGSFHGLIGHNGSGKSTLLKLIAGIHSPTSGQVHIAGRLSALLELGSGFHPDLTGRENIYLNGAILGLGRRQMDAAIDEIVDFSGIGDFIDEPVKVLSSGMYVRLGFAVAVHVKPDILIIDEVIAVGDESFQRKCLEHMYGLRRQGATIVLVSHSIPLVEGLCDEVSWLDHGVLQESGPSTDVCWSYMEAVNADEVERRTGEDPAHTDSHLPEIEIRRGSGEVRIFHLDYLDGDDLGRPVGTTGDPINIRLWYEAEQEIESPVFAVKVHHAGGTHLASTSTASQSLDTGTVGPGRGYVDLAIDRLLLMPGEYMLSTYVYDRDQLHLHDAWERSHLLPVHPGSSLEREGLIEIGGRWQHPRAHDKGMPGHPDR